MDIFNKIQSYIYVFIDLQKAFDTVDHAILLQKLFHYGVCGIVNDWFSSYLINRVQMTQIGSHVSEKQNTLCGVPQGSVLGPLLFLISSIPSLHVENGAFLIYVNDIYKASNKLEFFLFADDTNLLYANKNLRSLETVMNDELLKIVDWLTANKLSLNVKKTNYIIFHPYQKRLNYDVNIKILDSRVNKYFILQRKEYIKYLGVTIDNHLLWKHHINYVALKLVETSGYYLN